MIRCYRSDDQNELSRQIGTGIFLGVLNGSDGCPCAVVLFDGQAHATTLPLHQVAFVVRWGYEFDPAFNKGQR